MYAVEFSHRSGRDLMNVAKKRTNIIPIIEDARHPHKYRMILGKGSPQIYSVFWVRGFTHNNVNRVTGTSTFSLRIPPPTCCSL